MKNRLQFVLDKLNDIEYGFVDNDENNYPDNLKYWNSNFSKLYHLQSPQELIKNKYGVCWDQVELERFYLTENSIKSKSYFIIAYDNRQEPTHTFIVVKLDKYYWIEHSWEPYRGIHEYESLNKLLNDVIIKFEESIKKQNVKDYKLAIYEYEKPRYNLSCIQFMEHCEKGLKINVESCE